VTPSKATNDKSADKNSKGESAKVIFLYIFLFQNEGKS
jgi:hypothetical protein